MNNSRFHWAMRGLAIATLYIWIAGCTPWQELVDNCRQGDQQSCYDAQDRQSMAMGIATSLSYQAYVYQAYTYQPTCYTRPLGLGYVTTCR